MKTLANATAKEIENGVMSYTFNTEAETEAAVIECIEKGIKFNTTGRRSLVIYQPAPAAETYAVCWGVEYNEEEGESNAIAETTSKEDAKELAENESKDNNCRMCVVRKSDGKVIAIYDNTNPETPDNNDNTDNTMEANNTYNVVIANEACNFTATKYNTTLTGFAYEDAHNAAKEALRDIAGELGYYNYKVIYSSTLDAWTLTNKKTQAIVVVAKIEEVTDNTPSTSDTMNTETKVAKSLTGKAAALKDWRVRNKYNKAMREIARAWMNGKGYFVGSVIELKNKYGDLCHYNTTAPGADKKCVWAIDFNIIWKTLIFTAI